MKVYTVRELLLDHSLVVHPSRFDEVQTDFERLIEWTQIQANSRGTEFCIDVSDFEKTETPKFFILIGKDFGYAEFSFDPCATKNLGYDDGQSDLW